ncbi:MAG TPA: 6-carboxytetrahydropterin synthase [Bacteroidales bacterium]|nr:6-carboxytetrahydropterin synthase [Bacteroidales bacterium]HPS61817.1 6-carboxytetrahydropterin synthase [Bacteroidales bacterium]
MALIRVTKEFRFEAAHALSGYDGPCRNIHGHSYLLSVTVTGAPISDPASPKVGMVIDFGDLKAIIRQVIIDPLDHALLLNESMRSEAINTGTDPFRNVVFVPFQPTSENLLADFASRIRQLLPPGILLYSLRLRETANSYAEWFAEDN